jgi:hypothetical protein
LQHHDDASVLQHFAQGMVLQEQINGTGRWVESPQHNRL